MEDKEIENRALRTISNLHTGVDGDTAWAECYSLVFIKRADAMSASTGGYNH